MLSTPLRLADLPQDFAGWSTSVEGLSGTEIWSIYRHNGSAEEQRETDLIHLPFTRGTCRRVVLRAHNPSPLAVTHDDDVTLVSRDSQSHAPRSASLCLYNRANNLSTPPFLHHNALALSLDNST